MQDAQGNTTTLGWLLIMTREGITIHLRVDDIRSSGRSAQGVKAITSRKTTAFPAWSAW